MNLQQLEYILAVDQHRHFVTAAEHCHVTQATLSMMIKKLEDELNVKIFDRTRQPVVPTLIGEKIIAQASVILRESGRVQDLVTEETKRIKGELRIGIIPTIAPYLLPLFLKKFLEKHPGLKLLVSELTTDSIVEKIRQNQLDAGILAIPLADQDFVEMPLFYEDFVVYSSRKLGSPRKKYLLPADIDVSRLWLLEEGHCLRNQVINLCELKISEREVHQFDLTAASIETLKKIVDINEGITVLPELALRDLTKKQMDNIRFFKPPAPRRLVGLVSFRHFVKEKLIEALRTEILNSLPPGFEAQ